MQQQSAAHCTSKGTALLHTKSLLKMRTFSYISIILSLLVIVDYSKCNCKLRLLLKCWTLATYSFSLLVCVALPVCPDEDERESIGWVHSARCPFLNIPDTGDVCWEVLLGPACDFRMTLTMAGKTALQRQAGPAIWNINSHTYGAASWKYHTTFM